MMRLTLPGKSFFSPPKPQLPPAAPPIPTETDQEVKRKKDQARVVAGKRKGLLTTDLTASGTGAAQTAEDAPITRKKLLGS